jgi:hypothetical protein
MKHGLAELHISPHFLYAFFIWRLFSVSNAANLEGLVHSSSNDTNSFHTTLHE